MTLYQKLTIVGVAVLLACGLAVAAEKGKHPKSYEWSFQGPFGTYNRAAVQRGFQVYKEVCAACHSLTYFKFRNLEAVGFSADEIKAIAADYEVAGDPDEFGDPTTRRGLPQDGIPAPFANVEMAKASNNGALPPDLSVITRARHYGADYIMSLLVGYTDPPSQEIAQKIENSGAAYNPYFKGGLISMLPPLGDEIVEYQDGTSATLEQTARDVTYFLSFVADPHLEERHSIGLSTILYLLVVTVVLYLSKKKIWKPVYEGRNVVVEAAERRKKNRL